MSNDAHLIEIIRDYSALNHLKSDWDELGKLFETPLLQFDWFASAAESLHEESDLYIVTVSSNNRLKAVAPLVFTSPGKRWLELIGSATLFEHSGFLYDSKESLRILFHAVLDSGYPVKLLHLPDPSPILDEINSIPISTGLKKIIKISKSNYIDTSMSQEEFDSLMSKKRLREMRYKKNLAERAGGYDFEIRRSDSKIVLEDLENAVQIESKSWKQQNNSSMDRNKALRRFFQNYAMRTSAQGTLRIGFIKIANQSVAMRISIVYSEKLWCLKIGYDENWSKYSPGIQMVMETIRYCIENKMKSQEFLGSAEDWQHTWPILNHQFATVLLFPFSRWGAIGFFSALAYFLKSRSKKLLGQNST